ncbi:MAG: hypothetical protein GWM98_13520, partial [Nitrospinaceae bacterium]|nr:hypothetical protein [Nitrospinaceae bacterium]NIR55304.1 hypothetical protein [Nitrospinaceae bacterium]NIS85743.1 hypothetical protein [Nitrospinaceae bacterium]NIT82593.1 hypothetical protein [Nitrospinaceae bacterium]NIU44798.1 hypothetical protein [Nitrospinaceae bacterium]
MVKDYFEECTLEGPTPAPEMEEDALQALCRYDWPGNVKELREVLDKIWITGLTLGRITLRDLPENIRKLRIEPGPLDFGSYGSLEEAEQSWEKSFLIHHLRKQGWDLEQTSQALKTDPQSIRNKLVHHGIRLPEQNGDRAPLLQRTLKRSVVLCGSGLHSGIKTGLILQPMPPGSGIIFLDITSGQTIPARLDHVVSTDYSTCLKKGLATVGTIEHIMAVLHMYRINNLLIKIGDEAPVMDGSAKDFCTLIEDGEFEEQDGFYEELVIEKTYSFGATDPGGPSISIEPSDRLRVSYHMEYPEPIGVQEFTYEFTGEESFRKEIAPARTFGFL